MADENQRQQFSRNTHTHTLSLSLSLSLIGVESFFNSRYSALCLTPRHVTGAFSLERFAEGVERLSDFLHNRE